MFMLSHATDYGAGTRQRLLNTSWENKLPGPRKGIIERRRHSQQSKLSYYLYVPSSGGEGVPVLVSVHGISRRAGQHARQFAALAERFGIVLVAPRFKRQRFPNYQKLGLTRSNREEPRADHALQAILKDVAELTGAHTKQVYLFGYSGGGQFVHRYAMAYPSKVKAVAMGAPGWYTFPSGQKRFPRGLRCEQIDFDPKHFLQVPMVVFVGTEDCERDSALRVSARIDRQQGRNRIERGQHWVKAMREMAQSHGHFTKYEFHSLPGCGHSFKHCMEQERLGQRVFDFFFRGCIER